MFYHDVIVSWLQHPLNKMASFRSKIFKIISILILILLTNYSLEKEILASSKPFAKDIESIGDALQFIVPTFAFTRSLYDERESLLQFIEHFVSLNAVVYLLKYTVNEKRPLSDRKDSFPSGHTAAAFSGATFVHFRYSFREAWLLYTLSIFTGFSRVYAQKHHIQDVIASIGLSFLSSWIFVKRKTNKTICYLNYEPERKNYVFNLSVVF